MQILFGRAPDLARWEATALWPGIQDGSGWGDNRDQYEREVGRESPGPPLEDGPHRRAAAAILRYEVFPPRLVSSVLRRVPVEPGDTVGICYHGFGLDLFFAARVTARFDHAEGGWWRTGFTYRTLVGHPELGEETFSAEKELISGSVRVALRAWSRPGTALARAFAPIVRRLQLHASVRALDHLERCALGESSPAVVCRGL
jgi:Domain of unknown function (DUF1990)